MNNINNVIKKLEIPEEYVYYYGKDKAKIDIEYYKKMNKEDGKLILVTSINPTPYGEGKTTQSIGISMAMNKLNKNTMLVLREPSLGPVFGIKGGAVGGGASTVEPQDDINLHFTGDFHAITSANNLLCSVIDNHIFHGNELNIDKDKIIIKRVIDMNDRALRNITISIDGKKDSKLKRETGFEITSASELMAICDLAISKEDLKNRIDNMLVAYKIDGTPLYVRELNVTNAMLALLKDAINPNLVQTVENTPCMIHLGPFANIAHGCNSLIATKMALKMSDYVVTEAGFGADLGAEKFFDIKCRIGNIKPNLAVIVVTTKALKYNANVKDEDITNNNKEAIKIGMENLKKHIENVTLFGIPVLVCINKFENDFDDEIDCITEMLKNMKIDVCISTCYKDGSNGAMEIANKIIEKIDNSKPEFKYLYDENIGVKEKIECICKKVYGASGVKFSDKATSELKNIERLNYSNLPICIAKTQSSLTDNPKIVGRPTNFDITVTNIKINSGARFIVVYAGKIMTLPGLAKHSNYEKF